MQSAKLLQYQSRFEPLQPTPHDWNVPGPDLHRRRLKVSESSSYWTPLYDPAEGGIEYHQLADVTRRKAGASVGAELWTPRYDPREGGLEYYPPAADILRLRPAPSVGYQVWTPRYDPQESLWWSSAFTLPVRTTPRTQPQGGLWAAQPEILVHGWRPDYPDQYLVSRKPANVGIVSWTSQYDPALYPWQDQYVDLIPTRKPHAREGQSVEPSFDPTAELGHTWRIQIVTPAWTKKSSWAFQVVTDFPFASVITVTSTMNGPSLVRRETERSLERGQTERGFRRADTMRGFRGGDDRS